MHPNISSPEWWPFYPGGDELSSWKQMGLCTEAAASRVLKHQATSILIANKMYIVLD